MCVLTSTSGSWVSLNVLRHPVTKSDVGIANHQLMKRRRSKLQADEEEKEEVEVNDLATLQARYKDLSRVQLVGVQGAG